MTRARLALAALALLLCAAAAKEWRAAEFPDPTKDPAACGRKGVSKSWVCDPDGVLSVQGANVIEGILKDIYAGRQPYTAVPCGSLGRQGYQVAVAVMRKMALRDGADPTDAAQQFAKALHDGWGVGLKECQNGVLLLLAVEDRQVYVSTGKGARKALPDKQASVIIGRMKAPLREGEYDRALEKATREVGMALAGAEFKKDTDWVGNAVFAAVVGFFGFVFAKGAWESLRRRREYSGATSMLNKLRREQAAAQAGRRFPEQSCPICLQDFDPEPAGKRPAPSASAPGAVDDDAGDGDDDDISGDEGGVSNPLLGKATKGKAAASAAVNKGAGAVAGGAVGPSSTFTATPPSSSASPSSPHQGHQALVLPCGHVFCDPCISRWMGSNSTCPICRKPLTESHGAGSASPSSSAAPPPTAGPSQQQRPWRPSPRSQYPQFRRCWSSDDYMDEFDYRLMRMRGMYPYYITDSLMWTLRDQARRGQVIDWEGVLRREMADRAERQRLESSGAVGASSSFGGGGGGRGGGGAGGSW